MVSPREQDAVLTGVPQKGGGSGRVTRGGDDFEVVVDDVALGEGLGDVADLRDSGRVLGVAEQRGAEALGNPVAHR